MLPENAYLCFPISGGEYMQYAQPFPAAEAAQRKQFHCLVNGATFDFTVVARSIRSSDGEHTPEQLLWIAAPGGEGEQVWMESQMEMDKFHWQWKAG